MSNWTLFSNHGHVLVCLAGDSEARLRDVAADVGITERAVQKIVRDLQTGGMISVTKHGRRNRYRIHHKKTLRHELEAHCTLGDLVKLVADNRKLGNLHIGSSVNAPVDRFEAKTPTPEPAEHEFKQARQVAPEPVEAKPVASKPVEPISVEPESAKSVAADAIERQQGSLF